MVKFIPSLQDIENGRVKPQEGELYLLKMLQNGLNDGDYELYFNPMLNGSYPDIVVFKENYGIYIVEVKDWNLENYRVDKISDIKNNNDNKRGESSNKINQNHATGFSMSFIGKSDNLHKIISPMQQVNKYKYNIIKLYSIEMKEKETLYKIYQWSKKYNTRKLNSSSNPHTLISTAVYYYNHEQKYIDSKFSQYNGYVKLFGRNGEIIKDIKKKMSSRRLDFKYIFYSLKKILQPSIDFMEQRSPIILNQNQTNKSFLTYPEAKKIKGTAGSGKTAVLAKKAIEAYEQTNEEVLITYFNITLKCRIEDFISRQLKRTIKNKLRIVHFHQLIIDLCNENNICMDEIYVKNDLENEDEDYINKCILKLDHKKNELRKYKTILIDEGQDFEYGWFVFLKDCLLEKDGSYTIFADEKQNIYNKEQEQKNVKTNIVGSWGELHSQYRMGTAVYNFSAYFNNSFLKNRELMSQRIELDVSGSVYAKTLSNDADVADAIDFLIEKENVHINDIVILGENIAHLRGIDHCIRSKKQLNTITTFETKEIYDKLNSFLINHKKHYNQIQQEIDSIRKAKKFGFNINSGKLKISTIHSYKGIESHSVILLVEDKQSFNPELIYTAITRAKENLYILSCNNTLNDFLNKFKKYDDNKLILDKIYA